MEAIKEFSDEENPSRLSYQHQEVEKGFDIVRFNIDTKDKINWFQVSDIYNNSTAICFWTFDARIKQINGQKANGNGVILKSGVHIIPSFLELELEISSPQKNGGIILLLSRSWIEKNIVSKLDKEVLLTNNPEIFTESSLQLIRQINQQIVLEENINVKTSLTNLAWKCLTLFLSLKKNSNRKRDFETRHIEEYLFAKQVFENWTATYLPQKADIERMTGTSYKSLNLLFREQNGVGIVEYLKSKRLGNEMGTSSKGKKIKRNSKVLGYALKVTKIKRYVKNTII